ncbi:MAG TPA: DUF1552 domain-containing protein [Polyangia bacterium]|nr:DUF1552 domain-containing protein [Polyangia bacterium]
MNRFSRRSLLKATGASGLLLPLLNQTPARASAAEFPKRVVFMVVGNGTTETSFWPTVNADGTLKLGEITSPLETHKAKLLFPRGVDMRVWSEGNPFGGNGDSHHNFGAILTATKLATGDPPHDPGGPGLALASSISIDQFIGRAHNTDLMAKGQQPLPFPVLSVRAHGRDGSGYATLSWTGNKSPVSAESDPHKLFTTLFQGRSTGTAGPDPVVAKMQRTRRSLLDYAGAALGRQAKRLGTDDRQKIQLHLDSIRSIEQQLVVAPLGAACTPQAPAAMFDFKPMANCPALVDAEIDLMTAAMACGLTRVATFAIGDGEDYDFYFPWLGIAQKGIEFPTRHKHDIAHRPGVNNVDKITTEKWFFTKVGRLLDKFASVPEGSGTMLDNTVFVYINSQNSGFGHTVLKMPIVVAAGANIGIRTGRLVDFNKEAHNKLLASVANAVGVPMDGWGDTRFTGTLPLT